MAKKKILILGTRRSGSTFLGKLLSFTIKKCAFIEEPFNPVRGIRAINHVWYPYLGPMDQGNLTDAVKAVISLKKIAFKNSVVNINSRESSLNVSKKYLLKEIFKNESGESYIWRLARLILKSNHFITYQKARFLPKSSVLIKDSLMTLMLEYLSRQPELSLIFIFRDPEAFYLSMKIQGWAINTENFLNQKGLIKQHPDFLSYPKENKIDKILNEWIIVNTVALTELKRNKSIICVSHTRLANQPLNVISLLFKELNIEHMPNEKTVLKYTQGSHRSGKTKDVRRNSKDQLNKYKSRISETAHIYKELLSLSI